MEKKNRTIFLMMLPLILPFIIIFAGGIALTILQSFGIMMFGYDYGDHLFAYRELFTGDWFFRSLTLTLFVSFTSSILSVAGGVTIAYGILKLPMGHRSAGILSRIPLILPHIAVAFIVIILFSKSGLFSSISFHLNLTETLDDFPSILFGSMGADIILANIYKETPFVIIMVYAVLLKIDNRIPATARMLGAGEFRIFFRVILPFIMPIISTVFLIIFVYNFGSFEIPYVLGSSSPGMLSIKAFDYFFRRDLSYRPVAMAILVLIILFSMIFIYLYLRVIRRIDIGDRKL